ncbi:hypothetical protein B0H16DRAFT_1450980 [Mycena metata]|uniref:Uncharacterized protein n=1 Tax=Mycena metata TaxID=1033252 RepID=A0AAD7JWF0_9AGAR|nr:hypothetical protein B0H16DRAFT_1450980 [Mycena metata]
MALHACWNSPYHHTYHDIVRGELIKTHAHYYPQLSGVLNVRPPLLDTSLDPTSFSFHTEICPPRDAVEAYERHYCMPPPSTASFESYVDYQLPFCMETSPLSATDTKCDSAAGDCLLEANISQDFFGEAKALSDSAVHCVAYMAPEWPGRFMVLEATSNGPQVVTVGTQLFARACWEGPATVLKIVFTKGDRTYLRAVVNSLGTKIFVVVGSNVVDINTSLVFRFGGGCLPLLPATFPLWIGSFSVTESSDVASNEFRSTIFPPFYLLRTSQAISHLGWCIATVDFLRYAKYGFYIPIGSRNLIGPITTRYLYVDVLRASLFSPFRRTRSYAELPSSLRSVPAHYSFDRDRRSPGISIVPGGCARELSTHFTGASPMSHLRDRRDDELRTVQVTVYSGKERLIWQRVLRYGYPTPYPAALVQVDSALPELGASAAVTEFIEPPRTADHAIAGISSDSLHRQWKEDCIVETGLSNLLCTAFLKDCGTYEVASVIHYIKRQNTTDAFTISAPSVWQDAATVYAIHGDVSPGRTRLLCRLGCGNVIRLEVPHTIFDPLCVHRSHSEYFAHRLGSDIIGLGRVPDRLGVFYFHRSLHPLQLENVEHFLSVVVFTPNSVIEFQRRVYLQFLPRSIAPFRALRRFEYLAEGFIIPDGVDPGKPINSFVVAPASKSEALTTVSSRELDQTPYVPRHGEIVIHADVSTVFCAVFLRQGEKTRIFAPCAWKDGDVDVALPQVCSDIA